MADDREQILATLEALRRQLDNTPSIDSATAAKLRATLHDIEKVVEGNASPAGTPRLVERLGHAAREFEASHPILAGNVGSVIDALGQMGI